MCVAEKKAKCKYFKTRQLLCKRRNKKCTLKRANSG